MRPSNYRQDCVRTGTMEQMQGAQTRTETDIVTHGMTIRDRVRTETDIVTHGMTIRDIVRTETDIVTHGMTIRDIDNSRILKITNCKWHD